MRNRASIPGIRWGVFLPTALALIAVEGLAAFAARRAILSELLVSGAPATTADFLVSFAIGTLVILFILRFLRSRVVLSAFFSLALFVGILELATALGSPTIGVVSAIAALLLRAVRPRVDVHNIVLLASLSGIAMAVGVSVPPETVAVLLVILAFYDIVAVYQTRHMVTMVRGMLEKGAVFALVVPDRAEDWGMPVSRAVPGAGFSLLGTGDLALPAIFVVSVAVSSTAAALLAGAGSLLGILGTHLLFQSQKTPRPMAALPPIVAGTLIGYLASRFLFL